MRQLERPDPPNVETGAGDADDGRHVTGYSSNQRYPFLLCFFLIHSCYRILNALQIHETSSLR